MSNLKRIAHKMGWDRDKVIELTDRWLSAQHRADETFDGFLRAIAHEELVAKDKGLAEVIELLKRILSEQ